MRRSDRIITEDSVIVDIVKQCEVVNVAFLDSDGLPYVVPLNFGIDCVNGQYILYFHGANIGKKLTLIANCSNVSFSMYTATKLIIDEVACYSTLKYKSVCGCGIAKIIEGQEKISSLKIIMKQYSENKEYTFDEKVCSAVTCWKLVVTEWQSKTNYNN